MVSAAAVLRIVPLSGAALDCPGDVVEHSFRLLGLLFVRSRRVLRRRHVHDGCPRVAFRHAISVDVAGGGIGGGNARTRAWRSRLPRPSSARRVVRPRDAGRHVRRRHDRPQYVDRRRTGRVFERSSRAHDRSVGSVVVLFARADDRSRHVADLTMDLRCEAGYGLVRDSRRRGRRRGDGRPDVSLQDDRARSFVRARRHRGRRPWVICLVRDRGGDVFDRGSADRRPDERTWRHTPLGRTRRRRRDHHDLVVRVHRRRSSGAR